MGFKVITKHAHWVVIGASLLALGCQEQTAPLHLSVVSDQATPDHADHFHAMGSTDSCYINPDFHAGDDQSDNLIITMLSNTGDSIGRVFSPVVELSEKSFQYLSGDRPGRALQLMEDPASPDNRREGMNKMVDFGFLDDPKVASTFRKRCREIAQHDGDPMVRATAIRIANRGRDALARPIFVKGLTDPNEWVRLESAKALANVPDANAADLLVNILNNREETREIRIAAADALKHYRTLAAVRALSGDLDDKNFAIGWQARQSLRYLTDRDYGYNGGAWLAYFTGPESPLK